MSAKRKSDLQHCHTVNNRGRLELATSAIPSTMLDRSTLWPIVKEPYIQCSPQCNHPRAAWMQPCMLCMSLSFKLPVFILHYLLHSNSFALLLNYHAKLNPCERALFTDKVITSYDPPLPGLPVHALSVLNHDQTVHNTKTNGALVHSNCSVNQLLPCDVITLPANKAGPRV